MRPSRSLAQHLDHQPLVAPAVELGCPIDERERQRGAVGDTTQEPREFAIYDDADQLAAVKRACADLDFDAGTAKQHLARIDRWKNAGLLADKLWGSGAMSRERAVALATGFALQALHADGVGRRPVKQPAR